MADTNSDVDKDIEMGKDGQPIKKDDQTTTDTDADTGADTDTDDSTDDLKDDDIPVRGSAKLQHIIARKNKQIDKLKRKEEGDELGDGEELTPEATSLIESEINKQIEPIKSKMISDADQTELNQLFKDEPEAKDFEKAIKVYMNHKSWKQVPIAAIYHHLAFQDSQKVGANRRNVADTEGAMSQTGGRTRRPAGGSSLPTADEIANMSDADIEKLQNKVLTGQI